METHETNAGEWVLMKQPLKRQKLGVDGDGNSTTLRHRRWLQRRTVKKDDKQNSWRPQKKYRMASRRWNVTSDLVIKRCTKFKGHSSFKPRWGKEPWTNILWKK